MTKKTQFNFIINTLFPRWHSQANTNIVSNLLIRMILLMVAFHFSLIYDSIIF